MARPYPAGGVSIAESHNRCRRPAATAACGLQAFSGPTFPPCSRRHPYRLCQLHIDSTNLRDGSRSLIHSIPGMASDLRFANAEILPA
jgi:hypothetical protein